MFVHIHKRWHRDIFLIFVFFQTPLHYAAANGKGDVAEILLRNGANIHEKNVRNDRNEKMKMGWTELLKWNLTCYILSLIWICKFLELSENSLMCQLKSHPLFSIPNLFTLSPFLTFGFPISQFVHSLWTILGGTHYWIGEWRDVTISIKFMQNTKKERKREREKMWIGEGEDFHIDSWWIMHHVIYFATGCTWGYIKSLKRWYRVFNLYFFRLHYTEQFAMEKGMLWRFSCAMEPRSMKKM